MDRLHYYQLIQHIKQSLPLETTRDYLLAKMCELKAPGTGNWLKALPMRLRGCATFGMLNVEEARGSNYSGVNLGVNLSSIERIRTRKDVRTTRRLDERQKRDEEVKVPHVRSKVSCVTKVRASI